MSCLLGDDEADVFVASSASGTRAESQIAGPSGSGGPFTVAGLHRGLHGVRVAGQGDFAGATARDTVEIRGSSSTLRFTLVQPAGGTPACGGAGAGGAGGGGESGTGDADLVSGGGVQPGEGPIRIRSGDDDWDDRDDRDEEDDD